MSRPEVEVADIFRQYVSQYEQESQRPIPYQHRKVIAHITSCRTAQLGGHTETCESCGYVRISYNSCRDRHCPKCQFLKKERWINDRNREVLPVQYFHVVFTVPDELAAVIYGNQKKLYALLLRCAGQTIIELGREPKRLDARTGAICILHTWGQKLQLHPHVHTIVPGGGLSEDNTRWISCKQNYFMPVAVLSKRFRRKFIDDLKEMYGKTELYLGGALQTLQDPEVFQLLVDRLYATDWVVYAKPAFQTPATVIEYLARYTHRIAISNYRILKLENDRVFFRYRDYRDDNKQKITSLPAVEFIRRFLLHVVSKRFVRIRYVGLLSNRTKVQNILLCRKLLEVRPEEIPQPIEYENFSDFLFQLTGIDLTTCPVCSGPMIAGRTIQANQCIRAP
jgi:predicted Zn-ribbon and HTH transcriptional regulator